MDPQALSLLANAARLAVPRLRTFTIGSQDDRAEQKAIEKAALVVALDVLERSGESPDQERVSWVASSLAEALHRAGVNLQNLLDRPMQFRANLLRRLEEALAPLDEEGVGLREMGIVVPVDEVASSLLEQLTDNLFFWGAEGSLIRDVALLLQLNRLQDEQTAMLPLAVEGEQARMVRTWITLETSPPQIEVHNESKAPIYSVVPTPALIAKNLKGETVAMVGHGEMWNVRAEQISPCYGYVWPLPHMASWQRQPLVVSQLHVDYTDAAGRRWRNAHDHVWRIEGL